MDAATAEHLSAMLTASFYDQHASAEQISCELRDAVSKDDLAGVVRQLAGSLAMMFIIVGRINDREPEAVGPPTPAGQRILEAHNRMLLTPPAVAGKA